MTKKQPWPVVAGLFFISLLLRPILTEGKALDVIAATVGEEIITLGDVITDEKIRLISAAAEASLSLPLPGRFSRETLDRVINRKLIFREAVKFRDSEPESAGGEELVALEKKFADREDFQRFLWQEGLTTADLIRRFSVERTAAAYAIEKVSLSVHVGTQEAEAYYKDNSGRFGGHSFAENEAAIKEMLGRQKGLNFLERWLSELRERGKIRYLAIPSAEALQ